MTLHEISSRSSHGATSFYVVLMLGVLFCLSGCQKTEPITRVVVDSSQSGIEFDDADNQPVQGRMAVAIYKTSKNTWTLKVSGPMELVDSTESQWMQFFREVKFNDSGAPEWSLPDGWSDVDVGSSPFAPYARLQIADGLTLSVSELPASFEDLSNINRWRGQLSLPPTEEVDLELIKEDSVTEFKLFDVVGFLAAGGMSPPFAGGAGGMGGMESGHGSIKPANITFDTPEGWTQGPSSQIVAARLNKVEGESTAQITVTQLPAELNEWEQVARNWAGEMRLESLDAEALQQRTTDVEVNSLAGNQIRLLEDDEEVTRGLIGIRVDDGDQAWFIKLAGEKELVRSSEEAFSEFINSIRFK